MVTMADDSKYPTRIAPYGLRMEPDLKDRVQAAASAANRSMNAEIVATLEEKYPFSSRADELAEAGGNLLAQILQLTDQIIGGGMSASDKSQKQKQLQAMRLQMSAIQRELAALADGKHIKPVALKSSSPLYEYRQLQRNPALKGLEREHDPSPKD